MKTLAAILAFSLGFLLPLAAQDTLIHYTETTGFDHNTRAQSRDLFESFGDQHNFVVLQDNDGSLFNKTDLAKAQAVIFSNTSGNQGLDAQQQAALQWFVDTLGRHLMGIHAATDTYRHSSANGGKTGDWDWYAETLGGSVQNNPNHTSQNHVDTIYLIEDHPSVANIDFPWVKEEEYYYWENGYLHPQIQTIMQVGTTGPDSYDAPRPVAWYRTLPNGAKVFYTSLGHKRSNFTGSFPFFEQLLEDAVLWLLDCPSLQENVAVSICEGETYAFGGNDLTQSGQYQATFSSANGCDSLVLLDLTVLTNDTTALVETICEGETVAVGSMLFSLPGQYEVILTEPTTGCDSVVNLDLTVLPHPTTELQEVICEGDTYTVGSSTYSESGTYTDILTASSGCDSIVSLDLTVLAPDTVTTSALICEGDTLFLGGQAFTESGDFFIPLVSAEGCDSIIALELAVETVDTEVIQEGNALIAQADNAAYQWLDCAAGLQAIPGATDPLFSDTEEGVFAVEITDGAGCVDTSACVPLVLTGLAGFPPLEGVRLFPNPVKDVAVLDLGNRLTDVRVELFTAAGQVIRTYSHARVRRLELPTADLPAGLYRLRVQSQGRIATLSFTK